MFPVLAPQVGSRVLVFNPVTGGVGWIDVASAAAGTAGHVVSIAKLEEPSNCAGTLPLTGLTVTTKDPRRASSW